MSSKPAGILMALLLGSSGVEGATADQLAATLGVVKPQVPVRAANVVVADLDGRTTRLEDFRGKVVFLLDPTGAAAAAYSVRGLPVTILIDRNQLVVGRAIGSRQWDSQDGRAYIRALLGEGP